MSAHDGWVYLDDPPQPERRRPATVPELAAHQASCPECRDPWFANPRPGCPSCDRDLSYPGAPGHECYTYAEQRRRIAAPKPSGADIARVMRTDPLAAGYALTGAPRLARQRAERVAAAELAERRADRGQS